MQNHNKDYDLTIVVPGNLFYKDFLTSFSDTVIWLMQNNYKFNFRIWSSANLSDLRNSLIGSYDQNTRHIGPKLFGGMFTTNKVLFIDSDTCWTTKDLELIISSDKEIITGIVSIGNERYSISKRVLGEEPWGFYTPYLERQIPKDQVFEVDACGAAFMCIKSEVLENMDFPWFSFKQEIVGGDIQPHSLGEDYYFCENAKSKGYKIFADSRIRPGHIKMKAMY